MEVWVRWKCGSDGRGVSEKVSERKIIMVIRDL